MPFGPCRKGANGDRPWRPCNFVHALLGNCEQQLDEAIKPLATRAVTERALAELPGKEPEWGHVLFIAEVDVGGAEVRPSLN